MMCYRNHIIHFTTLTSYEDPQDPYQSHFAYELINGLWDWIPFKEQSSKGEINLRTDDGGLL
jgi:hypothetical protein